MESVRLSTDYPAESERRVSLNDCNGNGTEQLTEDTVLELEKKCYIIDQDDRCKSEAILKMHSPVHELFLSGHKVAESTNDVEEELADNIDRRIHELPGK